MKVTIFYSWQSDTRAAANRTLIQDALDNVARDLTEGAELSVDFVVDRDTQNVPGSPDIASTIFSKIDVSHIVVGDVTIVNSGGKPRLMPNPNVLIELGYAFCAIEQENVILVQNTAFGGPERLPFDLRQRRVLTYSSPEDATERAASRKELQAKLREAIKLIVEQGIAPRGTYPATLSMTYKLENMVPDQNNEIIRHDYQLCVTLRNGGAKTLEKWHINVEYPKPLLPRSTTIGARVESRSTPKLSFFRTTHEARRKPLYPGDKIDFTIPYMIDEDILDRQEQIFQEKIRAHAYVDDELVASCENSVGKMQKFWPFS